MGGLPGLCRLTRLRCLPWTVVPLVLGLALIACTAGTHLCAAGPPSLLRVIEIDKPATTAWTPRPREAEQGPSSGEVWIGSDDEEVWIGSNEPPLRMPVPREFGFPRVEPAVQPVSKPVVVANPFLRYPVKQTPLSEPGYAMAVGGEPETRHRGRAAEPRAELRMPSIPQLPEAPRFRARPSAAWTTRFFVDRGSPKGAEANETIPHKPSRQTYALTQPGMAEASDFRQADALRAPAEQSDQALFRTTSSPGKPAKSVFRPAPVSGPSRPASAAPRVAQAESRPPSRPTDRPAVQTPSVRAQAEQKSPKPTEYSTEFTVKLRHRKTLRTKLDVVGAAAVDKSVCHVAQPDPRTVSLIGMRQGSTPVTFWFRAASHRPVTCLVRVIPNPDVRQVALHVKIAELKSSFAGKLDIDQGLESSRDWPLLRALSKAEAGANAIVLTDLDVEHVESGLHWLQRQDVVRILSRPTLVTLSGQPATVVAGDQTGPLASGDTRRASGATTGLRAALTLLPVVTDNGQIHLEVVSELRGRDPKAGVDEGSALHAREMTTKVQLRQGQTLVIGFPMHDTANDAAGGLLPAVAQMLDFKKASRGQAKLVVLVTPELIRPAGSARTGSLASFEANEPRKDEPALKR